MSAPYRQAWWCPSRADIEGGPAEGLPQAGGILMKKLVIRREILRPLAPPTLDEEHLEKVVGGTEAPPPPPREGDPDAPDG